MMGPSYRPQSDGEGEVLPLRGRRHLRYTQMLQRRVLAHIFTLIILCARDIVGGSCAALVNEVTLPVSYADCSILGDFEDLVA